MIIVHIFTFLSAMGLMTACTQADMTDNTLLPEGSCPLGLNVSITDNSAATRATPDGTWKGDGTESVAIGVSFDATAEPTLYQYTVTGTDGSMTSENPYYWGSTSDYLFVRAWYPYAESLTSVGGNDDQSTEAGFQAADWLCSGTNVVQYANRQYDIELYHITAKVVVNLVREGIMADGRLYNVDESPETTGRLIDEVFSGDAYAMTRAYYDNVAKIPRLTGCSIIGHFDLVTKFNEKQPMFDEQDKRYLDAALSVMEYLVKQDMIFEINTGAISRGWRTEPYPDMRLLRALYDMGGRIMLNSDSHHRDTVAYGFELAKRRAKEAGFSSSVLLTENGFLETAL